MYLLIHIKSKQNIKYITIYYVYKCITIWYFIHSRMILLFKTFIQFKQNSSIPKNFTYYITIKFTCIFSTILFIEYRYY